MFSRLGSQRTAVSISDDFAYKWLGGVRTMIGNRVDPLIECGIQLRHDMLLPLLPNEAK